MSETSGPSSPASGTPHELFTSVPVDLFRSGNAAGPRLDNIRDQDVTITNVRTGDQTMRMVSAKGGLSTFGKPDAKKGVKWWKIPKGTQLPDTIKVVKDGWNPKMQAYHYSLQPARLMPLSEYAEGLKELAKAAIPMFTAEINPTAAQDEDDEKGSQAARK